MCLAIPAEVIKKTAVDRAIVNIGGVQREISLALVPEVDCGDFVIVHVGYALAKLNQQEAEKNLALFKSMLGETE